MKRQIGENGRIKLGKEVLVGAAMASHRFNGGCF
jgi:hypothetical protein